MMKNLHVRKGLNNNRRIFDHGYWKEYHLIKKIIDLLQLKRNSYCMIENILNTFLYFKSIGIQYTGNRVDKKWGGNKHLLSLKSSECKIIAHLMENGYGLRAVHQLINEYR